MTLSDRSSSVSDLDRSAGEEFSALAWEIARTASLFATDGGGVRARVQLGWHGQTIQGLGATSTEAMRDLARELDKWSERQP